jgi:hypothetical protein
VQAYREEEAQVAATMREEYGLEPPFGEGGGKGGGRGGEGEREGEREVTVEGTIHRGDGGGGGGGGGSNMTDDELDRVQKEWCRIIAARDALPSTTLPLAPSAVSEKKEEGGGGSSTRLPEKYGSAVAIVGLLDNFRRVLQTLPEKRRLFLDDCGDSSSGHGTGHGASSSSSAPSTVSSSSSSLARPLRSFSQGPLRPFHALWGGGAARRRRVWAPQRRQR